MSAAVVHRAAVAGISIELAADLHSQVQYKAYNGIGPNFHVRYQPVPGYTTEHSTPLSRVADRMLEGVGFPSEENITNQHPVSAVLYQLEKWSESDLRFLSGTMCMPYWIRPQWN